MDIVEKKITELIPYKNNPCHNDNAVQYVANSIKEFGFRVPIVIDSDGTIVCGHTRYKAAKSLGLKKVPCVVADDLTPEQIKAFRLADNKVGELSEWDIGSLDIELEGIGLDMGEFGFSVLDSEEVIDPEESLRLIEKTLDDESVDVYKVGKLNHYQGLDKKVDWSQFLKEALRMVRGAGKRIYVKHDLRIAAHDVPLYGNEVVADDFAVS